MPAGIVFSAVVHFKPHIGKEFERSSPRMLILGESVYESEDGTPGKNVAREMVRGVSTHEWNNSFFTRIQNIFSVPEDYVETSPEQYELDRTTFWNRVAFYEYVQEPLSGPRVRPSPEQWAKSEAAFREVVDKLRPDIIVALGYQNYENLPDLGHAGKVTKMGSTELLTWEYKIGGKICYVCRIQHPSSFGFKAQVWTDLFEKFLKKLK